MLKEFLATKSRKAAWLSLATCASLSACSTEVSRVNQDDESAEETDFSSSIDEAVDFEADDSLTRPLMVRTLRDRDSASASYSRQYQFHGYWFTASANDRISATVQSPTGSPSPITGHRLSLYRLNARNLPTGRAVAVGSSSNNGIVTTLATNLAEGRYVLIAYRMAQGSSIGRYSLAFEKQTQTRCVGSGDCSSNEICSHSEGSCGLNNGQLSAGVCITRPQACAQVYQPVCGCDGKTYSNSCMASVSGMSVKSQGECPAPSRICGGIAGFRCGEGQYCEYAPTAACGAGDRSGTCKPIPEVCTREYNPVCGCNGETYSNACTANANGTSVASQGACEQTNRICGTRGAAPCNADEYCSFPLSADCGRSDSPGVCEPRPQLCMAVIDPVRGCDGALYNNVCEAARAGVSPDPR